MIKAVVVGYGNIGKYAIEAINAAPDIELLGVVRRTVNNIHPDLKNTNVVDDITKLGNVDVAILCAPSKSIPEVAVKYLELGINTVDSYDIHASIYDLKTRLDPVAKSKNAVSIISAGWDPGSDSVVRALMEVCAPKGITYTNFGEGMSMGHTVAVKAIDGVENALSVTIPAGNGIHKRMVYVQLKQSSDFNKIQTAIKNDPYFIHDETYVINVPDVNELIDMGHGVRMTRKGVSGTTHNQMLEFGMRVNNPALTSQIMVSCARASMRQAPGAYTMIEIPMIHLLNGNEEDLIRRLV